MFWNLTSRAEGVVPPRRGDGLIGGCLVTSYSFEMVLMNMRSPSPTHRCLTCRLSLIRHGAYLAVLRLDYDAMVIVRART